MPDFNKYGVDRSGFKKPGCKHRTHSLFAETNTNEAAEPSPYSLSDNVPGKVSVRQIYMDMEDPTEHKFAIELLGSWQHWEVLKNTAWFKPYLESYRAELQARLRGEAIGKMAAALRAGDASAIKWFAEKDLYTSDVPKAKRGRVSNEDRQKAARDLVISEKEERDTLRRLGLGGEE